MPSGEARVGHAVRHRATGIVLAALLALAAVASARADGEAGLVIQDGDVVTTYCIVFQGDGISGDALLRAAGQQFDAYGGGSGLAVCSIGERGCQDASSFSSCFCQCQGGDCTYWAFFTRTYGKNWVYSSLAFNLLKAKDGDLHGWKWGKGAPNSAPVPQDVTFDQVCGHVPRGGAAPAATSALPTSTPAARVSLVATAPPSAAATSAASPVASPTATPPLVTITNLAPTRTVSATPAAPATADTEAASGNGFSGLVAFGAVAAVLVVAIVAALVWRRTHAR